MKVKVLFFASLREAVGRSTLMLDIPSSSSVDGLIGRLREEYPVLQNHLPYTKVAVNHRLVDGRAVLRDGDEIALLPPVGGG